MLHGRLVEELSEDVDEADAAGCQAKHDDENIFDNQAVGQVFPAKLQVENAWQNEGQSWAAHRPYNSQNTLVTEPAHNVVRWVYILLARHPDWYTPQALQG